VARIHRTRSAALGLNDAIPVSITIPNAVDNGIWKCRIVYGQSIEQITFEPYQGRSISTMKCIHAQDDLDYRYKGERTELMRLYDQRGDADDILIIRNGFVTDSYWSNVILSQDGRWYTPATPLLKGVMRQSLLGHGRLTERIIRMDDLSAYDQIMTINALNPFDLERAIGIDRILA